MEMEFRLLMGMGHIIEVPMTAAEMEAIIGGYHGDAFRVLGPHPIGPDTDQRSDIDSEWTIRAWLPQPRSASTLLPGLGPDSQMKAETIPMERVHAAGL